MNGILKTKRRSALFRLLKGLNLRENRKRLWICALCALAGIPSVGESSPFGFSLFCASTGYEWTSFFSCLFSAAVTGRLNEGAFFTALLILVFKLLFLRNKKGSVALKCASAVIGALPIAVFGMVDASNLYSKALAVVAYAVVPLFTFLLCGFFEKSRRIGSTHYEAALLAAAFIAVKFFVPFKIYGVSLAFILAFAVSLCGAKRGGMPSGGVFGFCAGLALGAEYVACLGVGGLCAGLFMRADEKLAGSLAFVSASIAGLYFFALPDSLFCIANLLAGLLLYSAVSHRIPEQVDAKPVITAKRNVADEALAEAFLSLSDDFSKLSRVASDDKAEKLSDSVKACFEANCKNCHRCSFDRNDLVLHAEALVRKNGFVSLETLPAYFIDCKRAEKIMAALNRIPVGTGAEVSESIKRSAEDYFTLSKLIRSYQKRENDDRKVDSALSQKAHSLLWGAGLKTDKVKVRGKRFIEVEAHGVEVSKIHLSPEEISGLLSTLVERRLSNPEFILCDGYATMRLQTMPKLRIECARTVSGKSGEKVCGDSAVFFQSEDKRFFALISDGMGSGTDAALSSRLASVFLEKLLSAGGDKRQALIMLNRLLVAQKTEVFTTVDLLEVDLINGSASLLKAGAAPSFVVRGGSCIKVSSATPPAGIIGEVYAEQTSLSLKVGDTVVLFSDGLCDENGDSAGVERFLSERDVENESCAITASKLLNKAKGFSNHADDMTVCVIRILAA